MVSDGEDPPAGGDLRYVFSPAVFFHPENRGHASARNTGARAAEGDLLLLLLLDDNATPVTGWVHQHLEHHRALDEGGNAVVFIRIVHKNPASPRSSTERYMREARDRGVEHYEAAAATHRLEFGRIAAFGLNASLRRSTLMALGAPSRG